MRYGIIFWGASSNSNIQRVFVLQKRAIRVLGGLEQKDSCRNTFKELKILTVASIYISEVITFACTKPASTQRNHSFHDHYTRSTSEFNLPPHKTTRFSKKPSYAGAKLFNQLPNQIKQEVQKNFKLNLKNWLLEDPVYNIEEFAERCSKRH